MNSTIQTNNSILTEQDYKTICIILNCDIKIVKDKMNKIIIDNPIYGPLIRQILQTKFEELDKPGQLLYYQKLINITNAIGNFSYMYSYNQSLFTPEKLKDKIFPNDKNLALYFFFYDLTGILPDPMSKDNKVYNDIAGMIVCRFRRWTIKDYNYYNTITPKSNDESFKEAIKSIIRNVDDRCIKYKEKLIPVLNLFGANLRKFVETKMINTKYYNLIKVLGILECFNAITNREYLSIENKIKKLYILWIIYNGSISEKYINECYKKFQEELTDIDKSIHINFLDYTFENLPIINYIEKIFDTNEIIKFREYVPIQDKTTPNHNKNLFVSKWVAFSNFKQ